MSTESFIALLLTITGSLIFSCGILIRMYLTDGKSSIHKRIDGIDDRVQVLEINRIEEQMAREEMLEILKRLDNVG